MAGALQHAYRLLDRGRARRAQHGDAVEAAQPQLQRRHELGRVRRMGIRLVRLQLQVELLGLLVQQGQVLVARVEEFAHLFIRLHGDWGGVRGVAAVGVFRDHRQALLRRSDALVHAQQHARGRRQLLGQNAGFRQRHLVTTRHVGQGAAQLAQLPRLRVLRELLQVDTEGRLQPQQHVHGERPLVVLDLVQIAGRYLERLRQRSLGQAALLAQCLQVRSHESLAHVCKHRKFTFAIRINCSPNCCECSLFLRRL